MVLFACRMVNKDKEMDEAELRERYLRWCMETGSLMSESGYEAYRLSILSKPLSAHTVGWQS